MMAVLAALFQSTPAIADGRTRQRESLLKHIREFQSTPAIADGRTAAKVESQGRELFQSTPAIADGRTAIFRDKVRYAYQFQSTPAIADGRTASSHRPSSRRGCFNPRPPSLTGEHAAELERCLADPVSIHARHR